MKKWEFSIRFILAPIVVIACFYYLFVNYARIKQDIIEDYNKMIGNIPSQEESIEKGDIILFKYEDYETRNGALYYIKQDEIDNFQENQSKRILNYNNLVMDWIPTEDLVKNEGDYIYYYNLQNYPKIIVFDKDTKKSKTILDLGNYINKSNQESLIDFLVSPDNEQVFLIVGQFIKNNEGKYIFLSCIFSENTCKTMLTQNYNNPLHSIDYPKFAGWYSNTLAYVISQSDLFDGENLLLDIKNKTIKVLDTFIDPIPEDESYTIFKPGGFDRSLYKNDKIILRNYYQYKINKNKTWNLSKDDYSEIECKISVYKYDEKNTNLEKEIDCQKFMAQYSENIPHDYPDQPPSKDNPVVTDLTFPAEIMFYYNNQVFWQSKPSSEIYLNPETKDGYYKYNLSNESLENISESNYLHLYYSLFDPQVKAGSNKVIIKSSGVDKLINLDNNDVKILLLSFDYEIIGNY